MKRILSFLFLSLLLGTSVPSAKAAEEISLDFFYDNLEPYGTWQEVGNYGYCWQPHQTDPDWRPYSDGRWVQTEAGWTWDSDEPFGWAVYHYGRWASVSGMGWIWIPGTEWGPGWVSWRHSDRYEGWAPLPPEARFRRETGFRGWVDDYYDIGPSNYCFVEGRNFGSRHLRSVLINRRQNINLITQTVNITNISYSNHLVHNEGPSYDHLAQLSENPIGRYKLNRRQSFGDDPGSVGPGHLNSRIEGDSFSVFAPPIGDHAKGHPKQAGKPMDHAEIDHGWRDSGSEKEIDEARSNMKSKVKRPQDLPNKPAFERPQASQAPDSPPRGEKNRTEKGRQPDAAPRKEDNPPMPREKTARTTDRPPNPDEKPAKPKHLETPDKPSKQPQPEPRQETKPAPKKEPRAEPHKDQPQESKPSKPKSAPSPERAEPRKSAPDSNDGDPKTKKSKGKGKPADKSDDR